MFVTSIEEDLNKLETPPRPFTNVIKGLPPKSFVNFKNENVFPQLNGYRNLGYPRNIQEVVGYLSSNKFHKKEEERILRSNPLYGPIIKGDPFSVHKPEDPSDINLLSLGNFRFAPSILNNFVRNKPNLRAIKHDDDSVRSKVTNLILNVFPVGNEYRIIAEMPDDERKRNRNQYLDELSRRNIHPKKFALFINLYETNLDELDL